MARVARPKNVLDPLPEDWEGRLDHFADFCSKLVLENGELMVLQDFQRWILEPYFQGVWETAIELPTGNGKTSLLGALNLWHCMVTPFRAKAYMAANGRDQATTMLIQAGGYVERTDWLKQHFKLQLTGQKRIIYKPDGSTIQAISAQYGSNEGLLPTLVSVDELGVHKSLELYAMLKDKTRKARNQFGAAVGVLSISTASDSEEGPLGRVRSAALALPTARRDGVVVTADDEAGSFAWRELSLEDNDNHEDFELVKKVNPLPQITIESLREAYSSPSMEPWQWARHTCGIWLGGENSAFDAVAWRACGRWPDIEENTPIWLGVDLGWRKDSTALVPFIYDESLEGEEDESGNPIPSEIVGLPVIIEAPNDGTSTAPTDVLKAISRIHRRTPIEVIVLDINAEGHFLVEAMRDHERWPELNHIKVIPHSQDPSPMSDACMGLAESIRAGRIAHPDGHAELTKRGKEKAQKLTSHILAAGAKITSGERWRIVKQKGGRKIDAAVALAIVRAKRLEKPKKPTVTAKTYAGWKI